MRGRTDELHAALVRLVVRTGAFEARQERVVDVDGSTVERDAQVVAQDLHVASEHDEVDPLASHHVEDASFLFDAGLGRHREVVERDTGRFAQAAQVGMV